MYSQVIGNLTRQAKALELLERLQLEEFDLLMQRNTAEVSVLEFSVHELLRQIAVEREDLKTAMQGIKVKDYAEMLADEEKTQVHRMLAVIDMAEQRCARQAEKNTMLSLSLLDQSHELMSTLHNHIAPKEQLVYGSKGGYATHRPAASIFSGRL